MTGDKSRSAFNGQIYEEACEWFVSCRGGDLDGSARREFDLWLRKSPEHLSALPGNCRNLERRPLLRSAAQMGRRHAHRTGPQTRGEYRSSLGCVRGSTRIPRLASADERRYARGAERLGSSCQEQIPAGRPALSASRRVRGGALPHRGAARLALAVAFPPRTPRPSANSASSRSRMDPPSSSIRVRESESGIRRRSGRSIWWMVRRFFTWRRTISGPLSSAPTPPRCARSELNSTSTRSAAERS